MRARDRAAVRLPPHRAGRARLDPAARLGATSPPSSGPTRSGSGPTASRTSSSCATSWATCSRTASTPTSSATRPSGRRCRCCCRRRCSTRWSRPRTTAATPTPAAFTDAFYADPVRRYMLPVFSDRRTDWPSHPHATRDSLHEHDMWVAEGLTHRYPTKVLAELLPTCPQYCGHCTRMDLVGNSTPVDRQAEVRPQAGRPATTRCSTTCARTPGVRDVVVSGGDVANMPWKNLEAFVDRLLEIENIRDIRLATKALMGLPQHWLQDEVRAGMERLATTARERGVQIAIHTHVNHAQSVTPLVADATRAMLDAGIRDVRNQGVLHARRQRRPRPAARPVLRAARRRRDHAVLLLHVRHDPVQRALAGLGAPRRSSCSTRSWATCPASRRRGSSATCRSSASAGCTSSSRLRPRARHLVLDEELPDRHRARGPRGAGRAGTSTTTRSTRCPAGARRGGASTPTTSAPATRRRWSPLPRPGPPAAGDQS